MSKKLILCLEASAEMLGVTVEELKDLIQNGDIKAMGTQKNMISRKEIEMFIGENTEKDIDTISNQRYNPTTSIEVIDLSEEDFEKMKRKSNGEGSVYFNEQRNKWYGAVSLGYDNNGKRIRKVVTGESKEAVEKKIQELKNDAMYEQTMAMQAQTQLQVNRHPKAEMLFKDYINEYLEIVENKTRATTYLNKCTSAKHIKDDIGNYKMCELNMSILEKFVNDLTTKKYVANWNAKEGEKIEKYIGQATIHKVYILLHSIIKYAVANDVIDKDYMAYIKKPKTKAVKNEKNQALSDEQIKILKGMVDEQSNMNIKLFFYLSMGLGCRPSEVYALRFSDFDYEKRTVTIKRTLSVEQKVDKETAKIIEERPYISNMKNYNPQNRYNIAIRTLSVSESLINMIKQYEETVRANEKESEAREKNGTTDCLFVNHEYKITCTKYYIQQYKRMLKKNGYKYSDYTVYSLRHSYCTRLMRETDLKTVQKIIGDNSAQIVLQYYANMGQQDMNEATGKVAENLEKVFSEVVVK